MLQFCVEILVLHPYQEIRSDTKSDPYTDPKFPEKSDSDPKKIISDPQHCQPPRHFRRLS